MQIFEQRQFTDDGPNDRGEIIGYVYSTSPTTPQELVNKQGHSFVLYKEITSQEYLDIVTKASELVKLKPC